MEIFLKHNFKIKEYNGKFYIVFRDDSFSSDLFISKKLNISIEDYRVKMKNFGGYMFEASIVFDDINEAEKALDWITSVHIIEKLKS